MLDGSTTAHKVDYAYDPAGNVTKIVDHAAGYVADTQCYHYDYLRRVTEVWTQVSGCAEQADPSVVGGPAPYWQTFAYDLTGNRVRKTERASGPSRTASPPTTTPTPASTRSSRTP